MGMTTIPFSLLDLALVCEGQHADTVLALSGALKLVRQNIFLKNHLYKKFN